MNGPVKENVIHLKTTQALVFFGAEPAQNKPNHEATTVEAVFSIRIILEFAHVHPHTHTPTHIYAVLKKWWILLINSTNFITRPLPPMVTHTWADAPPIHQRIHLSSSTGANTREIPPKEKYALSLRQDSNLRPPWQIVRSDLLFWPSRSNPLRIQRQFHLPRGTQVRMLLESTHLFLNKTSRTSAPVDEKKNTV